MKEEQLGNNEEFIEIKNTSPKQKINQRSARKHQKSLLQYRVKRPKTENMRGKMSRGAERLKKQISVLKCSRNREMRKKLKNNRRTYPRVDIKYKTSDWKRMSLEKKDSFWNFRTYIKRTHQSLWVGGWIGETLLKRVKISGIPLTRGIQESNGGQQSNYGRYLTF